jgi:cyanophycinase
MRCFIFLACMMGLVMDAGRLPAADHPDNEGGTGSLVIIGGSERFDHREYWDEIVELAGGPGCHIAVIPAASSDPIRSAGRVVSALNKSGADAFVVPLAWRKVTQPPNEIASDPEWVNRVREATGVFMIGGEQERIVKALQSPDGRPTPMLEAMWHVYRKGGVIAGTSAGAAVMSRIMFRDTESVLQTGSSIPNGSSISTCWSAAVLPARSSPCTIRNSNTVSAWMKTPR